MRITNPVIWITNPVAPPRSSSQPVLHTPRARMSYRRARPLPSRQSFFSPRLRGTVVPSLTLETTANLTTS